MGIIVGPRNTREQEPLDQRAPLKKVLDFANRVRQAGGGELLEGLLPAVPEQANECLIARALNFSCKVQGGGPPGEVYSYVWEDDRSDAWFMFLENEDLVDKIAEATGMQVYEVVGDGEDPVRALLLPKDIGLVAAAFDAANTDPDAFPEEAQYIERHPRFLN